VPKTNLARYLIGLDAQTLRVSKRVDLPVG